METKSWDDLEQLARSQNPHERVSAVTDARTRAGKLINNLYWGDQDLREANSLRVKIAHYEYKPTIEEAVSAVRVFFEAWKAIAEPTVQIGGRATNGFTVQKEGWEEQKVSGDDENKDENPTVPVPDTGKMQTETMIVNLSAKGKWHMIAQLAESEKAQERKESIFHAWRELTAVAVDFHTLYPDQVYDPNNDIGQAINDVCEILGMPGLFVIGGGEDERSKKMVVLSRVVRGYQKAGFPTAEAATYIVNTLYNLCTAAREFVKKRRNENLDIFPEKGGETEEPEQLNVLELAEELGVGSEEVMSRCVYLEIPVTSLVSSLSDEDVFKLREEFKRLERRGKMMQTRNGTVIHRKTAVVRGK